MRNVLLMNNDILNTVKKMELQAQQDLLEFLKANIDFLELCEQCQQKVLEGLKRLLTPLKASKEHKTLKKIQKGFV